jgi:hypothetical protein
MIVKESIEFQRGGEDPLKNMRIGMSDVVQKRLLEAGIGQEELEKTKSDLEELSRWTTGRKEDPKAGKELSSAFNKHFDEADKRTDRSFYSNPEARIFVKNLIFKVREDNNYIDIDDVIGNYIIFMEKFEPDPNWFKEMLDGLLYDVQMY